MAQISVSNLTKSFGSETVLENIQFQVRPKDKIGIVGHNGCGKTTLFNILMKELDYDSGDVYVHPELRIGYLKQNVHITLENSVYEECKKTYWRAFEIENELLNLEHMMAEAGDKPDLLETIMQKYQRLTDEFAEEGGLSYQSEIKGMLKGMGFTEEQYDLSVNKLSGGEKSRLELASMLLGRPDILLLDEPTNHLDMDAVAFLEGFLKNYQGTVLLISHDRYFLDNVVNRVFMIENHKLHDYDCGYKEYASRRKKDLEVLQHAYENQQKEILRQKEIIERLSKLGGSKRKRGISQSRSRQKLLDKMILVPEPEKDKEQMRLRFTPKYESGEDVLDVKNISKSFDGNDIFSDITFSVKKGEKIGLVGDNGVGKTTLFKLILSQLKPDEGQIRYGSSVKTAFFDQEQATLNDENTMLDEVWDKYPRLTHFEVRSYLAKFQFTGDDIFRMVGELSGGEKARVALLKLMLSSANFLLLDEPTNHLDIESREVLEEALLDYDGTCLVISHDRYFLNHVCKRILKLTNTGIENYIGNYDDYVFECKKRLTSDIEEAVFENKTQQKKNQKKIRSEQKERKSLKTRSDKIMKEVDELTKRLYKLKEESFNPDLYENHERARAHHDKIEEIQIQIDEKTDEWFELQAQLEEE